MQQLLAPGRTTKEESVLKERTKLPGFSPLGSLAVPNSRVTNGMKVQVLGSDRGGGHRSVLCYLLV